MLVKGRQQCIDTAERSLRITVTKSKQKALLASNTNSRLQANVYGKQTYFYGKKTQLRDFKNKTLMDTSKEKRI